jgi:hypothetical protein
MPFQIIRNATKEELYCPICGKHDKALEFCGHHCTDVFCRNRDRGLKSAETRQKNEIERSESYFNRLNDGFKILNNRAI